MDYKKRVFDLTYLAVCAAFIVVMLATGWNFFPLVAVALAAFAAVLILLRTLFNRALPYFLWYAYTLMIVGTFIFCLAYGAEPFGKKLWWNLVLVIAPAALAIGIRFVKGKPNTVKAVTSLIAVLMIGSSLVYVFFMNLRFKPTVERMWDGHDEYLDSMSKKTVSSSAPNVLVILMDDMGYGDTSMYSYLGGEDATINTPNIDSIADGGIYMDNFYASAPVCTPSRYSALTGRYAARGYMDNVIFPTTVESQPYSFTHFVNPYQFLNNVDGLLGDEITIAEALDSLGYDTSCIGKWNLGDYGEYLPTNQGFDYFYGSYYVNDMTPYNWVEEKNGEAVEVRTHKENLDQSESTRLFTDKVLESVKSSVEGGNKFFTYYTTPWPHYPIYSDNDGNGVGDKSDDSYIDCIEEFDRYLGTVFDYMKSTPDPSGNGSVYDNTLVVFTSDNGPGREGVTGALRGRKNTTFDGGMKVPLLASYPNGNLGDGEAVASTAYAYYRTDTPTAASSKKLVSSAMLIDLFPTILDYVVGDGNLPTDRIIDGVSLKNLWSGDVSADTRVHDALYYMKRGQVQGIQMPVDVNGTVYDFKYYPRVHSENSAFIDQFYNKYLFNLDTDPAEGYNVAMIQPEVAETLNNKLEDFKSELKENRRGIL